MYVLINTFTAQTGRQQEIAQLIEDFTETVTRHLPGFISATVHRGLDGIHVANYACWQTQAHFLAMFADPIHVQPNLKRKLDRCRLPAPRGMGARVTDCGD
jgi:heme-degrading monooxygenase HmoA